MRIGYPCINLALDCRASRTFRLASLSEERLVQTVDQNLSCLERMLAFNRDHGLFFLRITSDLIPFASHPAMTFPWQAHYLPWLKKIGGLVRESGVRVSMHPDQFVLLNALDPKVTEQSLRELDYHADLLDSMGLDASAKIQIHVGGVYGDKRAARERFITACRGLEPRLARRLVVENDDTRFHARDCLQVHAETGVPVVFDTLHHECLRAPGKEPFAAVFAAVMATWKPEDGPAIVDYASQDPHGRRGKHTPSLDLRHFRRFLQATRDFDFDVMLEIKDKEASALAARAALAGDPRLRPPCAGG